ncbi:MAG: hypothetical protein ACYDGN_15815 [Acidimicrobiales bacterium]
MATEDGSAPATPRPPVEQLGYPDAAAELDEIIAELDRGVVDIDLLEDRMSRAVEIVEELDRRIRGARERVGALLPRLEQITSGAAGDDG